MTEKQLNLKKAFFYQYYGQFVFKPSASATDKQTMSPILDKYIEHGVLELRRFTSLTADEGKEIAKLLDLKNPKHEHETISYLVFNDNSGPETPYQLTISTVEEEIVMMRRGEFMNLDMRPAWDYLRKIGIAFQWRDYSVKEQQEEGWIQFPRRGDEITYNNKKGEGPWGEL